MTDRPACPPPPERRQLVRHRGKYRRPRGMLSRGLVAAGILDRQHVRLKWAKPTSKPTATHHNHQGETTMPTMTPDDDDRPTNLEMCLLPRIPKDLTVEQADALRAEIWANDALPDHAKAKLAQQIDYRLEQAAGKHQQPQSVSAGVAFNGASPDEVMRGLKALAAQR